MFSQRRIRLLVATAVVVFILYLHYSGENSSVQNQKFYQSTVAAINAEKANTEAGNTGDPLSHTNIGPAGVKLTDEYTYVVGDDKEEPAIPKAQPQQPQPQPNEQQQLKASSNDDTEEISIAGRTKMTVVKEKGEDGGEVGIQTDTEVAPVEDIMDDVEIEEEKRKQKQLEDELNEVKAELNVILKRSPIIIFSKSYCPYSKKAKRILMDEYSIIPTPHVVELDQHPLGARLQALLGDNTGRRTVPNILVNGRSIGGGDDIAGLDEHNELASRLKSLGGKWLQEVKRKETNSSEEKA
ncbi:thioredoxin-like protein [Aspergillus karnatakaensis]|uniref:glutaredoxin n=1 Tax=Aspergillus karnatakaensis TaxID=1810916 RepID=UPI003CCD8275